MKTTLLALLLGATATIAAQAADLVLRYDQPALRWEQEALPIGNGQMGAMLFGGLQREQIQFNEESLWIGDEEDTGAYQAFGDVFVQFRGGEKARWKKQTGPIMNASGVHDLYMVFNGEEELNLKVRHFRFNRKGAK